jgi:hypothetical protein
MTPAALIRKAQADGVRLALSPAGTIKATGDRAALARWLPTIREHKEGIVQALKVSPGVTAVWWRIRYADGELLEVACCPPATHAEILERYPDAVAAEPFEPAVRPPEEVVDENP